VRSDPHPDPKQKRPKLVVFDLKPKKRLPRHVPLRRDQKAKQQSDLRLLLPQILEPPAQVRLII
jgi:hypothetical protein